MLALPRNGVPVAYEIARRLGAPLDVLVVRKIGVPGHAELAMGAVATGDVAIVDERVTAEMHVSPDAFDAEAERQREELDRRERMLRAGRPPLDVHGKVVVLVDDGAATGATMSAAIEAVRARGPTRIVAALPIAPVDARAELDARADETICLETPDPLFALGAWYDDFDQTSDAEVAELLDAARARDDHHAHARELWDR